MSEPPGLPAALGIEAVRWLAEGDSVTVRVQGRWRRRRPSSSGHALLVVETASGRQRFQAMPEPPSITGAAPGTWQMSFSVPSSLAPHLAERAWLQLGAVGVPLPLPVQAGGVQESLGPADPETLDERRRLGPEQLAPRAAERRGEEAESTAQELRRWISELKRSLEAARSEPERLKALLAERERSQRIAEQREYAERARRIELQEDFAAATRAREAAADRDDKLVAYALRVRELEQEVTRLRRLADQAEHAARAALAAQREPAQRDPGERESAERPAQREQAPRGQARRPFAADAIASGYTTERELRRRSPAVSAVARGGAAALASGAELLRRERRLSSAVAAAGAVAEQTIAALRRELEGRTLAEASLRGQLAALHAGGQVQPGEAQLASTLALLRGELDGLRLAVEREVVARTEAERRAAALERELREHAGRSARARDAIEQLRSQLARIGAPVHQARSAPEAAGGAREAAGDPVDPERFSAALSRLREASTRTEAVASWAEAPGEPGAGAQERSAAPWLERVFKMLVRNDAVSAGQLLLALLPAQAAVHPDPLAYDLVLSHAGSVRVTVREGRAAVERESSPRDPGAVQLQLIGELPKIARLLVAGRLRRRLGRLAQVRGERTALEALRDLVRVRLTLQELLEAGVRIEPALMFVLAAAMIDPAWSAQERFVLAYQRPGRSTAGPYLVVRGYNRATVSDARPATEVATTITSAPAALAALLAGEGVVDATISGDQRPLALLQDWLARAQRA